MKTNLRPAVETICDSYEADEPVRRDLIRRSCTLILDRFERNRSKYGFIDTKFHIVTGQDFKETDQVHSSRIIYGWIQGRGVESLTKHHVYFAQPHEEPLRRRIEQCLEKLIARIEDCRRANGGRLHFAMTPDGAPIGGKVTDGTTFADLFYGKGLYCAALRFKLKELRSEAEKILNSVLKDIREGHFASGQTNFDPGNPLPVTPHGMIPESMSMIALGALSEFILHSSEPEMYAASAADFLNGILSKFCFRREGRLCFCEGIRREDGMPYEVDGAVLCDPGHGIEFTGLAARCLNAMRKRGIRTGKIQEECISLLPELCLALFDRGFQPDTCGIVKSMDASSGRILNGSMPWWSLAETIRAAEELARLFPERKGELFRRRNTAWDALKTRYLQPNGFCCQTRDRRGRISSVIPAVPDADPGYHTNLCLMPPDLT